TRQRAVTRDAVGMTVASLARQRPAQGDVVIPQVARRELRRLVVDDMGLETLHDRSSLLCPDSGAIRDPASSCAVLARKCIDKVVAQPEPTEQPALRATEDAQHVATPARQPPQRQEGQVAQLGHQVPVGLEQRRQPSTPELVDPYVAAALALIAPERIL